MSETTTYDAVDALIYLDRALPLDWLDEQLCDYFADEAGEIRPDSIEATLVSALVSAREIIRDQARRHHDGRRGYSTGVPFERIALSPSTETSPEGEEYPVIARYHVQLHPDGTTYEPPTGGIWADEEQP